MLFVPLNNIFVKVGSFKYQLPRDCYQLIKNTVNLHMSE